MCRFLSFSLFFFDLRICCCYRDEKKKSKIMLWQIKSLENIHSFIWLNLNAFFFVIFDSDEVRSTPTTFRFNSIVKWKSQMLSKQFPFPPGLQMINTLNICTKWTREHQRWNRSKSFFDKMTWRESDTMRCLLFACIRYRQLSILIPNTWLLFWEQFFDAQYSTLSIPDHPLFHLSINSYNELMAFIFIFVYILLWLFFYYFIVCSVTNVCMCLFCYICYSHIHIVYCIARILRIFWILISISEVKNI